MLQCLYAAAVRFSVSTLPQGDPFQRGIKGQVCSQMRILSIDVGTRNFAMTVYCTDAKEFVLFTIKDFGKIKDCVATMREFTQNEPFTSADVILVEIQMRSMMKCMATSIRAFHFDKTKMIAPQSVKRWFNTCMKKHGSNKKAAVVLARKLLNAKNLAQLEKFKKKDDISDCVVQTHFYLEKFQPTRCLEGVKKI